MRIHKPTILGASFTLITIGVIMATVAEVSNAALKNSYITPFNKLLEAAHYYSTQDNSVLQKAVLNLIHDDVHKCNIWQITIKCSSGYTKELALFDIKSIDKEGLNKVQEFLTNVNIKSIDLNKVNINELVHKQIETGSIHVATAIGVITVVLGLVGLACVARSRDLNTQPVTP